MFIVTRRTSTSLVCVAALVLSVPAFALTGTVTDEAGQPFEGATVCYFVDTVETLCTMTTDAGFFELPDSRLDTIRIVASGYLPLILAAVEQDRPIVLQPAASILVRLVDAETGEGVADGEVEILSASGRVRRFPANRAGVRVRTFEPGMVTVTAQAQGYVRGEPARVELEGGEESRVEIRLQREEETSPAGEAAVSDPD